MKKYQAPIPTVPSNKNKKRCYRIYNNFFNRWRTGGKIVWLTDKELTLAKIKYSNKDFDPVLEKDLLQYYYQKYIHQTIE